jgi:GNAT superfamily N-acetyltransferase
MQNLSFTIQRLIGKEDAQKAYCCMTEVNAPWPDALCLCRDWIAANLGKYVEGFHLELADGTAAGHLYYGILPEALFPYRVELENAGILYCEWVQRRYQGQGLGRQLFEAFLAEMEAKKTPGIFVEATNQEGQMFYKDYLSRGFEEILARGHQRLMYLPLAHAAGEVQPLEPSAVPRSGLPVEIVIMSGYLCPYDVSTQLSIREISREFGDQVELREVRLTPDAVLEYGAARGIFINGRQKLYGGEPEGAVRDAIAEEIEHAR